ncbi:TonB-dependent receptor [Sphingopyxis sp. MG]|uniref:TonB-dependent receptor n=1 Tax=Sphingopyxis sp. MG TaxID=1866325 RepID=UPI000CDF4D86|nr:TonB-dependent receptor [Sphingopyxis sp. MG]AVA15017.1 TonB-dependent receptor [Sphingopyxis sp. MG]
MTTLLYAARRAAPMARASTGASACKTRLALNIAAPAFVAALACCPLSPAYAQDSITLPEIDVGSADDTAPTISGERVSASRLRDLQTGLSDTAAILRTVPGVSGYGAGGFSTLPVIRGLESQRLTVLVDGVAIASACPNDMNPPLSYTDPQTVGAIDVITGVSPVSYGGDSIGGIIRVESAPPRFAQEGETLLTGEASAFYRSNGDGFGGSLSVTAASDRISLTYNGSYTQADNFKGGDALGIVRSSEYAKTDHSLNLAAQVGSGLIELKGGYHFAPYEGFPNQYMDMTSNKSWFLNGHYAGVFDWGNLDLRANWRDTDHVMNFLDDKGGAATGGMPMNTEVHSAGYAVQADILLGAAGTLRVGNEFQHQWLNDYWPPVAGNMMMGPNVFININGAKRDRLGTFLEWEKSWDRGFTLIAGIRNDQLWMNTGTVAPYGTGMMQMADVMAAAAFNAADRKRHDSNWSGSVLARYALSDNVEIEAGYARKVRSPNIYERYSWGRGGMASRMIGWFGDGNGYVGNLALRPEKADTLSAALSISGGGKDGWSFKIAPYYTHVDDYIDAVKLASFTDMMGNPTGFDQLQFVNQKAEIYGIDISGAVPLWTSSSAGTARLTGRASWLRGQNLTDHGPLYHQMPFNAALGLEHRIGGLETRIDLDIVTEKDRADPTRNEPRTGSYALLNVQFAYRIDNVRLTLGADNLFDKAYYAPLGGMSLGDLKATGVVRPVPGRGRSVNAGVTVAF